MKIKILFFLLIGLVSCQNSGPNPDELAAEQKAWDEMMVVHDEVMPKISEMNQVTREFKSIEENEPELFTTYRERILSNKQRLESAEEAMFSWMSSIEPLEKLRETKNHQEIISHLTEETSKIKKISNDMLTSLNSGIELLSEFEALSQENAQ